MSHDKFSHPHGALSPVLASRRIPWRPALLVGAVFLVALLFVTLPNWAEFSRNVSQFSALWQISSNRRAIIFLVIRICSPLLIATMTAACCWLWYTLRAYWKEASPKLPQSQGQESLAHSRAAGEQYAGQVARPSAHHRTPSLPLTPIPEAFSGASATAGSVRPAIGEQQEDAHGQLTRVAQAVRPLSTTAARQPVYITITVLKALSLQLHVPGGKSYQLQLNLTTKEAQLIAYLAWLHGQTVHLDKLREHIFGHGKDDENATPTKLQEALNSTKKEIRRKLKLEVELVNGEAGYEAIPPDLDLFSIRNRRYRLAETCSAADLSAVEAAHAIIQRAFDDGLLVESIPEAVKEACDRVRGIYAGDFLADELKDSPDEFGTWFRKPFTAYRDYYLQAVLYSAEYELRAGKLLAEARSSEGETADEAKPYFSRAAQFYRTYAMRACDSRQDLKVTFGSAGKSHGERVDMSERTLRRAITLYGILGDTNSVNQTYNRYWRHMRLISAKAWEPSPETLQDLQAAQSQTGAYRFSAMTHEPLPSSMHAADRA